MLVPWPAAPRIRRPNVSIVGIGVNASPCPWRVATA